MNLKNCIFAALSCFSVLSIRSIQTSHTLHAMVVVTPRQFWFLQKHLDGISAIKTIVQGLTQKVVKIITWCLCVAPAAMLYQKDLWKRLGAAITLLPEWHLLQRRWTSLMKRIRATISQAALENFWEESRKGNYVPMPIRGTPWTESKRVQVRPMSILNVTNVAQLNRIGKSDNWGEQVTCDCRRNAQRSRLA